MTPRTVELHAGVDGRGHRVRHDRADREVDLARAVLVLLADAGAAVVGADGGAPTCRASRGSPEWVTAPPVPVLLDALAAARDYPPSHAVPRAVGTLALHLPGSIQERAIADALAMPNGLLARQALLRQASVGRTGTWTRFATVEAVRRWWPQPQAGLQQT